MLNKAIVYQINRCRMVSMKSTYQDIKNNPFHNHENLEIVHVRTFSNILNRSQEESTSTSSTLNTLLSFNVLS